MKVRIREMFGCDLRVTPTVAVALDNSIRRNMLLELRRSRKPLARAELMSLRGLPPWLADYHLEVLQRIDCVRVEQKPGDRRRFFALLGNAHLDWHLTHVPPYRHPSSAT